VLIVFLKNVFFYRDTVNFTDVEPILHIYIYIEQQVEFRREIHSQCLQIFLCQLIFFLTMVFVSLLNIGYRISFMVVRLL
jgi:hypothetical protein